MAKVYKAVLARLHERTLATHSNATLHTELQRTMSELQKITSVMGRVREVQRAGLQLAPGEQIIIATPRFHELMINVHTLQQQLASKMRRLAEHRSTSIKAPSCAGTPPSEAL